MTTTSASAPPAVTPTPDTAPAVNPRTGTEILPMPSESPQVAGMPRAGRAIAEPGDPGVIAAEDDVLDPSQQHRSNPENTQ